MAKYSYTLTQIQKFKAEQWTKFEKERIVLQPGKRISYFNNKKLHPETCLYDIFFHPVEGYDKKVRRSDRINPRIIHEGIFNEERKKTLSVLTSFDYGQNAEPLEFSGMYQRKINAIGDFYDRGRLTIKTNDEDDEHIY